MNGLRVTTGNEVSVVDLSGQDYLYKRIAAQINKCSHIEIVRPRRLKHPIVMVVDEEGLLKDNEYNLVGSVLYQTDLHGSPIAGDVIFMREEYGPDGMDLFGLTEHDISCVTDMANHIISSYKLAGFPTGGTQ